MSTELVKIEFSDDQIGLIKSQIAPKATNDELKLFLYQCKRTGLDPLARQIYAIHRWTKDGDKMTVQTSIDGFRVIAERSGDYAGQDEPVFEHDGNNLLKATVKVYRFRGDTRYCAAVGVAYWNEYVQNGKDGRPMGLWAKMPHTMLSKVAEALALRKAYPQDLSGLYTSDEMAQADKQETIEPDFSDVPDKDEKALLRNLVYGSDLTEDEKFAAFEAIDKCSSYDMYAKIQHKLEVRQKPIDQIPNPSQKDITNHIRTFA